MILETYPFDLSEMLDSEDGIAEYLRLVCVDGTPGEIARALGDISRACGMSGIAAKTGMARPALYKALSGEGNPELATIAKVAEALGFRLALVPITRPQSVASA